MEKKYVLSFFDIYHGDEERIKKAMLSECSA
jgi:hypothetical protein